MSIAGIILSSIALIIMIVSSIILGIVTFNKLSDKLIQPIRDNVFSNIEENNETTSNYDNKNNNHNNTYTNNRVYPIGESVTINNLKVTCTGANTNFQDYKQYANIRPGFKVIKVDFSFENMSTKSVYITFDDFDCYADYEDYDYFYSVDNATFSINLPSGKKYTGSVYFQIPSNSSNIAIEFESNVWHDREVIFDIQ